MLRYTNNDDDAPVDGEQHCDHTNTTTTKNDEVICESCGLVIDSELNVCEPWESSTAEYQRKAAGVSAMEKKLDAAQRSIDKVADRLKTKRTRETLKKTKDDTKRDEKRQRMKHRESTSGSLAFVTSCIELIETSYSSIVVAHRPIIEATLNLIYQSNIVNQCPIVAAYILNAIIVPPITMIELRSTIKGFTESDVPSYHATSRMQSISTALSNIEKMNEPVKPVLRAVSPPPASSASSGLYYNQITEAVTKQHTPETVSQIKLHMNTLCLMLGEAPSVQLMTDQHADVLIDAVHVGVRNREAIAGAVLYLLVGLYPQSINVRSFKRIQQKAIILWENNNAMREELHIMLLREMNKPLPVVHASLLADNAARFISCACVLHLAPAASEIDEIDWEPDANDVISPIQARRAAYVKQLRDQHPPHGVPSPVQISEYIRDKTSDLRSLLMELHKSKLLGDPQTVWANSFELQQLRGHSTGPAMRTTAIAIKQSTPAANRVKMRPIQSCLTEWLSDESQKLLWAHIEDLSDHYLRRLFASRFGMTKTNAWKDIVTQRLALQFKKARLVCGTTMFSQEHETLAATFIVSCMHLYFNSTRRIKACELYASEVCGDDVSPSTISVCHAKLKKCKGELEREV